ncbi:hypothetical protein [Rummeliibacillus pycnus]|uniref:hypothetical protein n=1 Tax=Rummeliibacillus pycnus TaxID=101070 RepID=UPI000C99CC8B|nr:hypothetical protein [Rummeliibacillus pycnus]
MSAKKFTSVGTDIEEVKRQNAQSGPTYNEIKEIIADNDAGNTFSSNDMPDLDEPKKYTWTGTDINEVKRLNAESGPSYNEIFEMLDKQLVEQNKNEYR